ncbi:MAG: DUF362 domain-containing protein [Acidobacteria bacterium]|nr:DUF362 domain-containing protein [Acidobacteriota bacterium]
MNDKRLEMTRRQLLAGVGLAAGAIPVGASEWLRASGPRSPTAPVSVAKCPSYDGDLAAKLAVMFDQIGGIEGLVGGKTVAIKLNLTGGGRGYRPYLPGDTFWVNGKLTAAVCHLLNRAGARRIRLLESNSVGLSVQDKLLDGGCDMKLLRNAMPDLEFENTNNLGSGKRYARLKVKSARPYIYTAFDLNHSYEDCDVFVSLAKMKHQEECGITLSMKNLFGITPCSIYGDDAGVDEPNEAVRRGRAAVLHFGRRQPSKSAPQEIDFSSDRHEGSRVPRIIVDLVAARPIDLAIIDGIQSCVGGEGPWVPRSKALPPGQPGLIVVGRNPVCTDTVATALMGYDPRAEAGKPPFKVWKDSKNPRGDYQQEHGNLPQYADNTMLLAEAVGLGSADLAEIDVRGVPIKEAMFDFESQRAPWPAAAR